MSKKLIRTLVASAALLATVATTGITTHAASKTTYKSELVKKNVLTVGTEGEYKPYAYRKDGKMTGFEVDFAKAVGKKIGVKVKIVPTKWDSLIAGVGSKRFDIAVDNITSTPARKKQYAFSNTYLYSPYILITKSGSAIKTIQDVKGKNIIAGTGTDNAVVAQKFGAKLIPNGNFSTTLSMIQNGRGEGTVNAVTAWNDYKKSKSTKGFTAKQIPAKDAAPAEIGALMSKKSPKLRKAINKAIKQLQDDGTLKKLSTKYLGSDLTEKE
ncbi:MAG: transporter substrate-binding domain-containing protein [Lactobacillus sp.]|jgi:cystine transport system substrate-binding protein|nr:transporter substrate-binding domain-containing protein [Lactobacillus sp.]MCI2032195.1 transporter substrate-binding domain-containing protein [Lactobacillus sp.]